MREAWDRLKRTPLFVGISVDGFALGHGHIEGIEVRELILTLGLEGCRPV